MNLASIVVIVSAVVIVLLLWLVAGARHLKYLRKGVFDKWEMIDEKLRKRQDMLPNLVETLRKFVPGQDQNLQELIDVRQKAAHIYAPGDDKSAAERDLAFLLGKLLDLGRTNKDLGVDTNFLELKKEFGDLEEALGQESATYNQMVETYNRSRGAFYLKPIAKIFGYREAGKLVLDRQVVTEKSE